MVTVRAASSMLPMVCTSPPTCTAPRRKIEASRTVSTVAPRSMGAGERPVDLLAREQQREPAAPARGLRPDRRPDADLAVAPDPEREGGPAGGPERLALPRIEQEPGAQVRRRRLPGRRRGREADRPAAQVLDGDAGPVQREPGGEVHRGPADLGGLKHLEGRLPRAGLRVWTKTLPGPARYLVFRKGRP